jgi:F-box/leucine-rich repeat protein 4
MPQKCSRKFEPDIRKRDIFSDRIRVEFEHSKLDYYTELDAIEISGICYDLPRTNLIALSLKKTADLFENLIETATCAHSNSVNELKRIDLNKLNIEFENNLQISKNNLFTSTTSLNSLRKSDSSSRESIGESKQTNDMVSCSNIIDLPNEILCIVLSYFDLRTIFRLRSTCKTFYQLCSHSYLFNKLDLQPYWHLVIIL